MRAVNPTGLIDLEDLNLNWCQRRDLNPRPKAYESSALPLSYSGTICSILDTYNNADSNRLLGVTLYAQG